MYVYYTCFIQTPINYLLGWFHILTIVNWPFQLKYLFHSLILFSSDTQSVICGANSKSIWFLRNLYAIFHSGYVIAFILTNSILGISSALQKILRLILSPLSSFLLLPKRWGLIQNVIAMLIHWKVSHL